MKALKLILSFTLCVSMCGCGTTEVLFTGAGAAGGAALGYGLSDGSLAATAGGAAAGALAAGGLSTWKSRTEKRQFESGYIHGRADGAKANYWRMENNQAPRDSALRYRRVTITIPARREGGVLYEPQTRTILIAE
jgi:hypothetical protein